MEPSDLVVVWLSKDQIRDIGLHLCGMSDHSLSGPPKPPVQRREGAISNSKFLIIINHLKKDRGPISRKVSRLGFQSLVVNFPQAGFTSWMQKVSSVGFQRAYEVPFKNCELAKYKGRMKRKVPVSGLAMLHGVCCNREKRQTIWIHTRKPFMIWRGEQHLWTAVSMWTRVRAASFYSLPVGVSNFA